MPPQLPPAFVSRLLAHLQTCDQPLIEIWGWPWSGKRRLFEALAAADPAAWSRFGPHVPLRRVSSGPRWLVAEGVHRAHELLVAAEALRPDQRLIFLLERRCDEEILPARSLTPTELLLREDEMAEMFDPAGSREVEELMAHSDGWLGPLEWLRGRWKPGQPPESLFGDGQFANRFHQRVTSKLDFEIFDLMIECTVAEGLDAALWRRVWIAQPTKLAALERVISEWGWLIRDDDGSRRLPRLLCRAARKRLPANRQRQIYRRLGIAAHRLGREADAERYLELAADEPGRARLRALAVAGATAAEPVTAAPVRGTRFSLQLLGQPMVRRQDGNGPERELSWRLKRAFQTVAFLALAPGRRASKDAIVDALWRDVEPRAVEKNFHPTMSEARRTLGDRQAFVFNQGLYTLNPDLDWWIDCELFDTKIDEGRRLLEQGPGEAARALDLWLEAWGLYRGSLLADVEAVWIEPRRQELYRRYVELLRSVGELCARLEQTTRALDAYRSLLLNEPFEEQVHLAVMELYARQGRRDLVRRQFVRMQELLLEELNVEPLEETQERYHQLMR